MSPCNTSSTCSRERPFNVVGSRGRPNTTTNDRRVRGRNNGDGVGVSSGSVRVSHSTVTQNNTNLRNIEGNITLDENRNASKPAVVLAIKDGKKVYDTSISP